MEPAGVITLYDLWNPETGAWQATAPTLYVDDTLYLRGHARNDSGAQMRGRMDARVTDPLGGVSTLTGGIGVMEASGAAQQGTWTFDIPVGEAGTWTAELVLYGELVLPGAPTASFSADPTSGPAPLTVYFTEMSTGDITDWRWDFEPGAWSPTQEPLNYTYWALGIHVVRLTVTGPGGSDSATETITVT